MLAAVAADAAGTDLAAVGDELPQQGRVLVVDVGRLVLAELADLLLGLANRGLGHRVLQVCLQREDQKGGSSEDAGGVDQGSLAPPPEKPPPPPPPPPPNPPPPPPSLRAARVTLAVAYRREGPISSTSSSMTVRFSPSFVSNDRCLRRPDTMTREPRVSDSATFSAACRQMLHRRNSASPSFHPCD